MEHAKPEIFHANGAAAEFALADAVGAARRAMSSIGHGAIDAVAAAERAEDMSWRVEVEVIESAARMGDNDFLAAYDVRLGSAGELLGIRRLRRYHREDRDQP